MSDNTSALRQKPRALEIRVLANEVSGWRRMEAGKPSGGARRDRTDDLLLAKQALSQLSYGPGARFAGAEFGSVKSELGKSHFRLPISVFRLLPRLRRGMVGLGRFELPTSRLSSARSNQLSYKPGTEVSNQKSVIRTLV